MKINVDRPPPEDLHIRRWKFTRISLFFLCLIACSIVLGLITVLFATGHDELLQYSSFILFVASGSAFAYFTEKLLGLRRLNPKQREKLLALIVENKEVAEYCRQVAAQNRYPVVSEYEALLEHAEKERG